MANWYNLRLNTIAYKNLTMINFESLLNGLAEITAINADTSIYIGTGSITTGLAFQVDKTDKASQPWGIHSTVERTALTQGQGWAAYDSDLDSLYISDGFNWVVQG